MLSSDYYDSTIQQHGQGGWIQHGCCGRKDVLRQGSGKLAGSSMRREHENGYSSCSRQRFRVQGHMPNQYMASCELPFSRLCATTSGRSETKETMVAKETSSPTQNSKSSVLTRKDSDLEDWSLNEMHLV